MTSLDVGITDGCFTSLSLELSVVIFPYLCLHRSIIMSKIEWRDTLLAEEIILQKYDNPDC